VAYREISGYGSEKTSTSISAFLYVVGYVIFVALFGIVMTEINYRNSSFNKIDLCGSVKKRFRRSGDEFIYYSICAFVSIGICIMCTISSVYAS